jgi:hypothetical protein
MSMSARHQACRVLLHGTITHAALIVLILKVARLLDA